MLLATDFWLSLFLLTAGILFSLGYALRVLRKGRATHVRVEKDQGSALLGKPAMEMAHWLFGPFAVFLSRMGISANGASLIALFFALAAVWPLSLGYFGIAACLGFVSAIFDLIDGAIARHRKTESDAGALLDAAIDRYGEFLLLAGTALYYRHSAALLALVLLNIIGTFMVSYASARAMALGITPPRGAMRRPERAFYMLAGFALTPIFSALWSPPYWATPVSAALAFVGVIANISAVNRMRAVARISNLKAQGQPEPSHSVATETGRKKRRSRPR